ncbi:MAG: hypothetical protein CMM74_02380 [Rhodospirillaceae bacterium]|jgi:hypothetical protein|nr:hypothetical protein [Rhodospirillaceae bacterium]MDP6925495.1 tripartite tricarboxylate transporter TctB family protein [Rhodospirillales bacterium]
MTADQTANGPTERRRFNFNSVAAIIFIALAIGLHLIIPYHIDKPLIQLSVGQFNLPPELFPQIIAVVLFLLGVWFLIVSFGIDQKNLLRDLDKEAISNVTITLIMMAIYVPLMVNLGFVFGSAILVFAMSTYFGNRSFALGGAISLTVPMMIYLIFLKVLFIELPPFPIDDVVAKDSFIYGPMKYLSNNSFF